MVNLIWEKERVTELFQAWLKACYLGEALRA
jgi:hypothetical protein